MYAFDVVYCVKLWQECPMQNGKFITVNTNWHTVSVGVKIWKISARLVLFDEA